MELLSLSTLKSRDQIKREPGIEPDMCTRQLPQRHRNGLSTSNQLVPEIYHSDPKQRRRAQNRKAARKFREKKRFHANNIIQDYESLQTENGRLRQSVESLQQANHALNERLRLLLAVSTPLSAAMECSLLSHTECEEYFQSLENGSVSQQHPDSLYIATDMGSPSTDSINEFHYDSYKPVEIQYFKEEPEFDASSIPAYIDL